MRKSDEQQNEELRRLLSGTFDEFGREPGEEVWSRIRAVIPSRQPWYARRIAKRSAILVLLFGLAVSGWLVFQNVENTRSDQLSRSTSAVLTSTQKTIQSQQKAAQRSPHGIVQEPLSPTKPILAQTSRGNSTNVKRLGATEQIASVHGSERLIQKEINRQRKLAPSTEEIEKILRRTTRDAYAKKAKRNSIDKAPRLALKTTENHVVSLIKVTEQSDNEQQKRTSDLVDKLTAKPVSFGQPPILVVPVTWENKTEPVVRAKQTGWQLTGDVMPLYTYQLLTTRNVSETYVQNFQTPSAFSGQLAGFKVALGVAQAQWKAQLTFTRMKRWAYYEIATNEYHVVPVGQNSSLVVRQGIPVAESTTLNLVGLRISREHKLFDQRRWQFLVSGGGEGAWSFTTQQGLLFATGSAVAAYTLSNQLRLRIAPTIDFGLTPLHDAKNLLQIRPYNVGLTVGIETRLAGKR